MTPFSQLSSAMEVGERSDRRQRSLDEAKVAWDMDPSRLQSCRRTPIHVSFCDVRALDLGSGVPSSRPESGGLMQESRLLRLHDWTVEQHWISVEGRVVDGAIGLFDVPAKFAYLKRTPSQ